MLLGIAIPYYKVLLLTSWNNCDYQKQEKKNYHHYERRYGKFERAFRLHSDVIVDKIDANFKNGVLVVELPKAEIAKPKEIEVKVK